MYFLVYLSNSKRVLVPSNWIQGFSEYKTILINYGIPYLKNKSFKIFVSPDLKDEPDFQLELSQHFKIDRHACYMGAIKYSFGKFTFKISGARRSL